MTAFIAILRGINLGSHYKLPMPELKKLCLSLKYENPETYIQSGNVVFRSDETRQEAMADNLSKKIASAFHYDVPVIVLSEKELMSVIKQNPFLTLKGIDTERLHVTFLAERPSKTDLDKITGNDYEPDRFICKGKSVYLYCPNGYGRTRLTNTFFESKLKVTATTRNWRTLHVLAAMASAQKPA